MEPMSEQFKNLILIGSAFLAIPAAEAICFFIIEPLKRKKR